MDMDLQNLEDRLVHKDILMVTQFSAEITIFLKIYSILLATTAFIALYSKIVHNFEMQGHDDCQSSCINLSRLVICAQMPQLNQL